MLTQGTCVIICIIFLGSWPEMVCNMQRAMRHNLYHLFCLWVSLCDDNIHTCIRIYMNAYMHTCIHTYTHTYTHTCTHTYMYRCIIHCIILLWLSASSYSGTRKQKKMIQIMTHGSMHVACHPKPQTRKDDTNYDACSLCQHTTLAKKMMILMTLAS